MRLPDEQQEEFCRLVVIEDLEPSEAAYRVGYGLAQHPALDYYHRKRAKDLLSNPKIVMRIEELRREQRSSDDDKKAIILDMIYRVILNDPTKYLRAYQTTLENGRVVQDVVIRSEYSDFSRWNLSDKRLIDHFDSKTGLPVFISKSWAIDKMLKILKIDGSATSADVEDIVSVFANAGLVFGVKAENQFKRTVSRMQSGVGSEAGYLPKGYDQYMSKEYADSLYDEQADEVLSDDTDEDEDDNLDDWDGSWVDVD